MDAIASARSFLQPWLDTLSSLASYPILSNPTVIIVILVATLIPLALFVESLGKNPPAVAVPVSKAKNPPSDSKESKKDN